MEGLGTFHYHVPLRASLFRSECIAATFLSETASSAQADSRSARWRHQLYFSQAWTDRGIGLPFWQYAITEEFASALRNASKLAWYRFSQTYATLFLRNSRSHANVLTNESQNAPYLRRCVALSSFPKHARERGLAACLSPGSTRHVFKHFRGISASCKKTTLFSYLVSSCALDIVVEH